MNGVYRIKAQIAHEDERRSIMPIFNGEFTAKQMKILRAKKGSILGNHYHLYSEIRYLMSGRVHYYLKNRRDNTSMEFIMEAGEIMMTGPEITHTGEFLEDSIMIEGTEDTYVSAEINDYKDILK